MAVRVEHTVPGSSTKTAQVEVADGVYFQSNDAGTMLLVMGNRDVTEGSQTFTRVVAVAAFLIDRVVAAVAE